MPNDVFETSKAIPTVKVVSGKAKDGDQATFTITYDGGSPVTKQGTVKDGVAKCEVVELPKVDDAKATYKMEYKATVGTDEYPGEDFYTVWPRSTRITAVDKDGKTIKEVPFLVSQEGADEITVSTGDDGSGQYIYRKKAALKIDLKSPWKLESWKVEKGRNRKAEVSRSVEWEFIKPASADEIKQLVNLTGAKDGQDGIGEAVTIEVGVKGDKDKEKSKRVSKKGDKCFIQALFSRTTKRDKKLAKLSADVKNQVEEDEKKKCKGDIELAEDGGTIKFKVHLGVTGGETCEIQVSGKKDIQATDPKLKFKAWRRLYYEIMAAAFNNSDLAERNHPEDSAKKVFDFPATMIANIKAYADPVGLDYHVHKAHMFAEDKAPAGTVYTKGYVGLTPANEKAYVLTDHTVKSNPTGANFSGEKSKQLIKLKLCDYNYYYNNATREPTVEFTAKRVKFPMGNDVFFPFSGKDGTKAILSKAKWKAKLDPAPYYKATGSEFEAHDTLPETKGRTKEVTVKEVKQNKEIKVSFSAPAIGHAPSSLANSEKTKIHTLIDQLIADDDKLRAQNNKLTFRLSGETGNTRRDSRLDNVEKELKDYLAGKNHKVATHPALKDNGQPRRGEFELPADFKNADGTRKELQFDLPDGTVAAPGPGRLVGPDSATKCKIEVTIKYQVQEVGLGLATGGVNLVVYTKAQNACNTDTLLHELGHSMGQTVLTTRYKVPSGLDVPKTTAQNDPKTGKKGLYYESWGSHCAFGLSEANKAANPKRTSMGAKCIMFDNGPSKDPSPFTGFCTQCGTYIKARNLSDIATGFKP